MKSAVFLLSLASLTSCGVLNHSSSSQSEPELVKIHVGMMKRPSPENAATARAAAFEHARKRIEDYGIPIPANFFTDYEAGLPAAKDVRLDPNAKKGYLNEAKYAGDLIANKVIQVARTKGRVVTAHALKDILDGICPIWPIC